MIAQVVGLLKLVYNMMHVIVVPIHYPIHVRCHLLLFNQTLMEVTTIAHLVTKPWGRH